MDGSKNENISVSGSTFHYFKDRLNGGKVFANQEKSRYLRTANASEIADEITLTRNLYQRGFPVPEVVATGALESGTAYYIEKSIGDRVFGDVFREETKSRGYVSDVSFDEFVDVIVKYCHAQFDHRNIVAASKNALAGITELENVMRNNPPSSSVAKVFAEALEKACERVMSLPWGFVQYDFNAFNVLQGGIIDFEFAGVGPIGYDVLTAVHFGRMWPKHRVAYVLTDDQIGGYLAAIDGVAIAKGCPAVSQHGDEFLVLKAIWSTAKEKASEANPQSNPDFWEWRVKMRDWCIRQYVNGEKIDSNRFEVAATAS
jgi:hypothetical protein